MDELNSIIEYFLFTPLWGIFAAISCLTFTSFRIGVFLGKRHRLQNETEDRAPINSIVAATLSLLAFFLAFTFGIAATKFDGRRELVKEEANAIRTTYLRAGYLDEAHKTQIRKLLKEYVDVRLNALKPHQLELGLRKSEELQQLIWQQAVEVAEKNPNSVVVGLFVQSLNQVIDVHEKRVILGVYYRIPTTIWVFVYFVATLSIGCLGYQIGLTRAGYAGITIILIFTFSSVITLIADLDSPQEGFVKVSQRSLTHLRDQMNQVPT